MATADAAPDHQRVARARSPAARGWRCGSRRETNAALSQYNEIEGTGPGVLN